MKQPARHRHDITEKVREWLDDVPERDNGDLLQQILRTTMRLDVDGTHRMDLKMINSALKELRYAAKVFAPYRDVRKVTIFGSARTPSHAPEYVAAVRFAKEIVQRGYMVITGAGGGIMEAGHVGAGKEKSFGVNIHLPFEQSANHVIRKDHKLVNFKYFFTRKVVFIKESAAVVLFPGGFGTLDEGFETLTLLQTGKTSPIPVILMDHPGGTYWTDWKDYVVNNVLKRGNISPQDIDLFSITEDVDEAVAEVLRFYRNYHSCRFVGGVLYVRLLRAPNDEELEEINQRFPDILASGKFERSKLVPQEQADPAFAGLEALRFHFDRRSHGRLRRLIDALNELPLPGIEEGSPVRGRSASAHPADDVPDVRDDRHGSNGSGRGSA